MASIATKKPAFLFLLLLVLSIDLFQNLSFTSCITPSLATNVDVEDYEVDVIQSHQTSTRDCDMSIGTWIYDHSYPLYDTSCPYLSTQVNCRRNGRPDSIYESWRWRPQNCSFPKFDALDFLGRMRRKRVMLVGDSIMRNQWESLVCLVEAVIPTEKKMVTSLGSSMAFYALDFEASIEFSWAPLLVELKEEQSLRILHLDSIEENAKYWRGVDILVFASAHWWTHTGKWSSWDFYKERDMIVKDLNPVIAYEKGLTTWGKWVDSNLDPRKTRVIFRSVSPNHNRRNGWECFEQREPLVYSPGYTPSAPPQLVVLQEVLKKMNFPVYLQDITSMSAPRRDGHPSIYSRSSTHESQDRGQSSDCSHWCLPGVPDAWNEVFYALLL